MQDSGSEAPRRLYGATRLASNYTMEAARA